MTPKASNKIKKALRSKTGLDVEKPSTQTKFIKVTLVKKSGFTTICYHKLCLFYSGIEISPEGL
jgi:hypothetical protein